MSLVRWDMKSFPQVLGLPELSSQWSVPGGTSTGQFKFNVMFKPLF